MKQAEKDLIAKLKADTRLPYIEDMAYILATVKHETANTFLPIEEIGKGAGHSYAPYYGRGYIQLTWKANYEKFGTLLGLDLVNHPELALDADTAYEIMIKGMLEGLFTGVKLSDFITDTNVDYVHARKIINSLDKANLIAGYAEVYENEFE